MARKLFGTDGVRGVAGELLSAELALALTHVATAQLQVERPRVLIVRDTRESGEMLQAAVAAGVAAAGGDALLGGVLPTPAAPLLLRRYGFDLAVVLSASHNPYQDNGIKFFGGDGYKLSDEAELAIEAGLDRAAELAAGARGAAGPGGGPPAIGQVRELHGAGEDYLRELHTRFAGLDLDGLDVLLDCANGATYALAPEIFTRLGAKVTLRAAAPDGRNINDGCGSTHIDELARMVPAQGHDIGFAFDGDGDRVLAVDSRGEVVDGDELLALAAAHLRATGRLPGDGVAVTVMTNFGFHAAMEREGVEVAVTQVGDRYVLEALRERDWTLGGEQSGHIIMFEHATTGDGILTSLQLLSAVHRRGTTMAAAAALMRKYPQVLVNVPGDASRLGPLVDAAVVRAETQLGGNGRVLVRPSGTEPAIRLMVQAADAGLAEQVIGELAAEVRLALVGH